MERAGVHVFSMDKRMVLGRFRRLVLFFFAFPEFFRGLR